MPFSIFPSSYKEDNNNNQASEVTTSQSTHEEFSVQLPHLHQRPGREGQYSSSSYVADESSNNRYPYREEEVRITREEERYRRPGVRRELRPRTTFSESSVDIDVRRDYYDSPIDIAEREYRTRYQPNYREEARTFADSTVDGGHFPQQQQQQSFSVEDSTTVDAPLVQPQGSTFTRKTKVVEDIVEPSTFSRAKSNKMGYYDEEGVEEIKVTEYRESTRGSGSRRRSSEEDVPRNTVTIPCHHIRIGDILILQGRPCQVIRISTSAATGQHRYLGVDLFTKKLHEESSFVSSPSPSVVVQTMLGPVFKQYRVLDLQEGTVVAMTETGDVKQGLPVIDQSNLWARLSRAFESGRGSVRVLVVNDQGRELAVDMKVVHGASL